MKFANWDKNFSYTLSDLQYDVHRAFTLQSLRSEKYKAKIWGIYDIVIRLNLTFDETTAFSVCNALKSQNFFSHYHQVVMKLKISRKL